MKQIDWPTFRLDELCDVRIGRTPRRDTSAYWGGDAVWVTISELDGGIITDSKEHVSDLAVETVMPEPIPEGTLLFSFKLSIGKMGIAGCPLYTNEAIAALPIRQSDRLSRDFLRYALMAKSHEGGANTAVLGKVLNKEKVSAIDIPLPPLDEQHRIVAILDEAEALRQLRARADERMAEFIPALFNQMFGDPADHPVKLLADAAEVVSGVAKGRRFNGQPTAIVPYLRVANVQAGYLDLAEIKTIEALPSEVEALSLKQGDVLLTEGGDFDKLGRGALLDHDLPGCIHQNHVFRVRVDQKTLTPIFFAQYLQTQHAKAYFLRCAKKTTNLASINMTQLRGLPVPLPPLALQREFAARVAEARALQDQQARSRGRLEAGFQAMLHRAFAKEL